MRHGSRPILGGTLQGCAGAALLLLAASLSAAELTVQHQAPGCLLAEAFPRLSARITPADEVVRARVLFRPEPAVGAVASDWYAVSMVREGDDFVAVLPRPRSAAGRVQYSIEATDASATAYRSDEQSVAVVSGSSACEREAAETVASASVVVDVPPGAPLVPPVPLGFSPVGASATRTGQELVKKGGHKGLFLGVAAAAAAGVATTQLAKPDTRSGVFDLPSGPEGPIVLTFSSPARGTQVSVSRGGFLQVGLRLVLPERLSLVVVRARFYNVQRPSQACGSMQGSFTGLVEGIPQDVTLSGLIDASPCGEVNRLQVVVQDDKGKESLRTGTASLPDLTTLYVFVP